MAQENIGRKKFAKLVLAQFPQLRNDFREWQGLDHLQMMEFALFTENAGKRGDWATVEKCLRLADRLLRFGDSNINNTVYVSYLEILPRKGKVHDRLREMMTSDLRKGWDDILSYLAKVTGSRR